MGKFSLSRKQDIAFASEFCGIPVANNTLPIIKEFLEYKGAQVFFNSDGGLNIDRGWYLTCMLRNLEFDERELQDLVDRDAPKNNAEIISSSSYNNSILSFVYNAKQHALDSVSGSVLSARENPKSVLMALTIATAAIGVGCMAFSKFKLK